MAAAALSKLTKLAIGTSAPATVYIKSGSANHGVKESVYNASDEVALGTLTRYAALTRVNKVAVTPSFEAVPSVAEWRALLPWVMNLAESGAGTSGDPYVYALGTTALTRVIAMHTTQTFFQMSGCAVDSATFSAQSGGPLKLAVECVGTTYTNTGSFPALTPDLNPPLIFPDSAITIGGTSSVYARDFQLRIAHSIDRERFLNSLTLPLAVNLQRQITIQLMLPWGQHYQLWSAGAGDAGVAVTIAFTKGADILTFTMPAVRTPRNPMEYRVPEDIMVQWSGECLSDGTANNELSLELEVA